MHILHIFNAKCACLKVVRPSLEEIQTVINDAVSEVTSVGRYISVWMEYEPQAEDLLFTPRSDVSSNVAPSHHGGTLQGRLHCAHAATASTINRTTYKTLINVCEQEQRAFLSSGHT